ncbi:MAG: histidine kinase, partial [Candidatus Viridilinea halotolerans]
YVPSGTYRIGGWEEGEPAADLTLPAFWIARLPITVAQFARFVAEGYRDDSYWTVNGLKWRGERTAPYEWGDPRFSAANQPVVSVTWYEATAFCAWLSSQLPDYTLGLPSEAEWEAAAAFTGPEARRAYPWGDDAPTPEHAVYGAWQINAPAPVGLCPAGMSACGALDLAGNVWERASSSDKAYPEGAAVLAKDFIEDDFDVPLRGGSWWNDSTYIRCRARGRYHPGGLLNDGGFRVVLSPRSHKRPVS